MMASPSFPLGLIGLESNTRVTGSPPPAVVPDMGDHIDDLLSGHDTDGLFKMFESIPYDQVTGGSDSCLDMSTPTCSLPSLSQSLCTPVVFNFMNPMKDVVFNVDVKPRIAPIPIADNTMVPTAPTAESDTEDDVKPTVKEMKVLQENAMDAQLYRDFPKEVLRGDKDQYKKHRTMVFKLKTLNAPEKDRLAKLRRKELSCVYADKARQRKAQAHSQANVKADDLQKRYRDVVQELATTKAREQSIFQQLQALQARVGNCSTCSRRIAK